MPSPPPPPADDAARPEPRDEVASTRVPDEVHKKATKRAQKEGRSLSAVLRAWLFGYAEGEFPSPPRLPGEDLRARKRRRQKKEEN